MENCLCEQGLGVIIVLKIKFGLSLRTFETSGKPNVTLWIVLIHHYSKMWMEKIQNFQSQPRQKIF